MYKKNILIISYVFPPYPGIGGRRWAKFAKYLHKAGHNVFIIAAQNPFYQTSTFINDIKDLPKENLFYLPSKYPSILLKQPQTLWEKIQYHFGIKTLPLFTKGNFYDRSIFWKKQLHQKVKNLIQEKHIDSIIVSGPPFHYVYETILLKKEFPNIKFIVDYRDEWTFNDVHGFGIISEQRKKEEFRKEKYVVKYADAVVSCDETILDYLKKNYSATDLYLVKHGYDTDDYDNMLCSDSVNSEQVTISYFGTIYPGIETFFLELSTALMRLREEKPHLYHRLNLNFYTIDYFPYHKQIDPIKEKINLISNVLPSDLFAKIKNSNFILILLAKRAKNYFTSKFPEIFYLQKPIILYSEDGKVSEFITKHKIGVHLPQENFYDVLINALQNPQQFRYDTIKVQDWDFKNLTEQLLKLL